MVGVPRGLVGDTLGVSPRRAHTQLPWSVWTLQAGLLPAEADFVEWSGGVWVQGLLMGRVDLWYVPMSTGVKDRTIGTVLEHQMRRDTVLHRGRGRWHGSALLVCWSLWVGRVGGSGASPWVRGHSWQSQTLWPGCLRNHSVQRAPPSLVVLSCFNW